MYYADKAEGAFIMIVSDEFRLNENRQEILSSLSDDFPYTCLEVELDHLIGRSWHWHTALNFSGLPVHMS